MKEDNRNFILAIVLSMLIILGWNYFYAQPMLEKQRQQAEQTHKLPPQVPGQPGQPVPGQPVPQPGTQGQAGRPPPSRRSRRRPACRSHARRCCNNRRACRSGRRASRGRSSSRAVARRSAAHSLSRDGRAQEPEHRAAGTFRVGWADSSPSMASRSRRAGRSSCRAGDTQWAAPRGRGAQAGQAGHADL